MPPETIPSLIVDDPNIQPIYEDPLARFLPTEEILEKRMSPISVQEIADIFAIPPATVALVLGKRFDMSQSIRRVDLWDLICRGMIPAPEPKKKRQQIPYTMRNRVIARDGVHCRYCGKWTNRNTREIDHILPASRGGPNHDDNLVVCCWRCNARKGTELLAMTNLTLLAPRVDDPELFAIQQDYGMGIRPKKPRKPRRYIT